jgi:geranylgeranyl pyrophosphate synthase
MDKYIEIINNYINTIFINEFPDIIKSQILNLLNGGGKKFRPVLFIIFAGGLQNNILHIACLIELIHNISLIIDDLPDMDNEIVRRNKPAFHIKNGIQYTHFFIYYLLNKCFIMLSNINYNIDCPIGDNNSIDNKNIKTLQDIISIFKINLNSLIDGQFIDIEYTTNNDNNKLINLMEKYFTSHNDIMIYNNISNIIKKLQTLKQSNPEIENEFTKEKKAILVNISLNLKKTASLFNIAIIGGLFYQLLNKNIEYDVAQKCFNRDIEKEMVYTGINNDGTKHNYIGYNILDDIENIEDIYKSVYNNTIFKILVVLSNMLGYLFQVGDDILDFEKDKTHNKPNICNHLTITTTRYILDSGCEWLILAFKIIAEKLKTISPEIEIDITTLEIIIKNIKNR